MFTGEVNRTIIHIIINFAKTLFWPGQDELNKIRLRSVHGNAPDKVSSSAGWTFDVEAIVAVRGLL